jgi:hypothetical protein
MKCKVARHKGTPTIYNKIIRGKNIILKMQTHKLNINKEIENLNFDKEFN